MERPKLGTIVRIRNLRLEESEAKFFGIKAGQAPETVQVEITGGGSKSPDQPGHFRAVLNFVVLAKAKPDDDSKIAEFKARFVLDYEVPEPARLEELRQEEVTEFLSTVAVHNAWPYAREFVHGMSLRMGIPAVVVPTFRVTTPQH